jgi:hypothetical protein
VRALHEAHSWHQHFFRQPTHSRSRDPQGHSASCGQTVRGQYGRGMHLHVARARLLICLDRICELLRVPHHRLQTSRRYSKCRRDEGHSFDAPQVSRSALQHSRAICPACTRPLPARRPSWLDQASRSFERLQLIIVRDQACTPRYESCGGTQPTTVLWSTCLLICVSSIQPVGLELEESRLLPASACR